LRYEGFYKQRYPDNNVQSLGMSSEEIFELDEFILFLNENLPMPFEAKYRTGLYALVTFSLHGRAVPWEHWIKHRNQALGPRWQEIEVDFPHRPQKPAPLKRGEAGSDASMPTPCRSILEKICFQ
jgi:hypothetical protein